jgi:hypothetical protein
MVDLSYVLIVEENSDGMTAVFDLSAFRKQLADQNKRTAGLTSGVFTRPGKKIKKLQRLSTKRLSVKENLEPSANVTAINLELGLRAFVEGFVV